MVLIRFLLLISLLSFPAESLFAADPVAAPTSTPAAAVAEQPPKDPVLSDLGPKRAEFAEFVEKSLGELAKLAELKDVAEKNLTLSTQLKDAQQQLSDMGDPSGWYVDRLTQVSGQFRQLRRGFETQQNELTSRQQKVETIQKRLEEESSFWSSWTARIKEQKLKVPARTVRQVESDLKAVGAALKKTVAAIILQQEKVGSNQQQIAAELERLESALAQLRKETFRKNAFSFFSPHFYEQLTSELLAQAGGGLITALKFDPGYLIRTAWILGLMLLSLVVITSLILRYRENLEHTEDWQFVLSHPLATALFAVIIAFTPLFTAPPELLRFVLLCCGVGAVITLAAPLTENRRQARILVLAAILLLLTTGFRLIALPQPIYRLYLALLSIGLVPILIWQIRASLQRRGPKQGLFFRLVLRIASVVLLVSLTAQLSGYMNFSFWLLQATFETGMVILFAHMVMRLGNGGVQFLLGHKRWAGHKFFKRYSDEFATRFERLLRIMVMVYGVLYLLPEWRLFASVSDAWTFFATYDFTLGDQSISLAMVLLALASFYLSMQVSWLLQAMSETQVFYRKAVDRGVRDAIKKLIHYAMVLVGLLFALSILGMRLQNFIVILGALGVGIGFGLQDIVNNFLSGLILLFERPVKVGDFIVVNEEWGTISKIGLRSTVVETINHSEIIVPNSQLIAEKVTNWTLSSRVARLVIPVGVAYGSNVELVMRILTEVATGHPDAVHDPAPSILFIEFGDSSLNFEIRVFVQDIAARFRIRSEMLQQIDAHFREAGVEIPFPQRDLHLRSVDGQILQKMEPPHTEPREF